MCSQAFLDRRCASIVLYTQILSSFPSPWVRDNIAVLWPWTARLRCSNYSYTWNLSVALLSPTATCLPAVGLFAINGVTVDDVFEKDALLVVDSARLLIDPEVNPSLAEERLRPLPAHPSTCDGCLTIHRPASPPVHVYVSPYATPDRIHAMLQAYDFINEHGLALPLDLSPVQFANGAHFLALESHHIQEGRPWYVFDLRRVTHPPLVTFWAMPQPVSSSLRV